MKGKGVAAGGSPEGKKHAGQRDARRQSDPVPEEELEEVKIGVDTVIMALMKIQEAEKVIRQ